MAGRPAVADPLPVTPVVARAGVGWAALGWTTGVNERDRAVTGYMIWRSEDAGLTWTQAGSVAASLLSPWIDTDSRGFWDRNLANGTVYTYVVQANTATFTPASACLPGSTLTCDPGQASFSAPVTVTPGAATTWFVDAIRFGTVYTESGNGFVRFLWTPTASLGETGVTLWHIFRSTSPGMEAPLTASTY